MRGGFNKNCKCQSTVSQIYQVEKLSILEMLCFSVNVLILSEFSAGCSLCYNILKYDTMLDLVRSIQWSNNMRTVFYGKYISEKNTN